MEDCINNNVNEDIKLNFRIAFMNELLNYIFKSNTKLAYLFKVELLEFMNDVEAYKSDCMYNCQNYSKKYPILNKFLILFDMYMKKKFSL